MWGVGRKRAALAVGLFASASNAGTDVVLTGRNVIAQGPVADEGGVAAAGTTLTVDLDYSNFSNLPFGAFTGPGTITGTGVGSFNNQADDPQLGPDFDELPGSPTIDAGDGTLPDLGSLDLGLGPRSEGAGVDIGADEADGMPPDTMITKKPPKRTRKRTATLKFSSTEPDDATFQCKIDKKAFKPCNSGAVKYKHLSRKRHSFQVRALDAFGNVDPNPAKYGWKVRK